MLFLGDWAPQDSKVFLELEDDFVFVNLEGPFLAESGEESLGSTKNKIIKAGPHIFNKSLPQIGGTLIGCLANNHSMDYGQLGVHSTLNELAKIGGIFVGFGENQFVGRKPLRISCQGKRISIIATAENQFGLADSDRGGIPGLGSWIYKTIGDEKQDCDFVIVSVHAGVEDYPLPAPYFQDLYRSYIDVGANAVIAHHPHVNQGYEFYDNSLIAYGLGNLAVKPEIWREVPMSMNSIGVKFDFDKPTPEIDIVPIEQVTENGEIVVREMNGLKRHHFDEYLAILNEPLPNRAALENLWSVVAEECWNNYLKYFTLDSQAPIKLGRYLKNRVKSSLKRYKICGDFSRSNENILFYHSVKCESHREIITQALNPAKEITKESRLYANYFFERLENAQNLVLLSG